MKLEEGLRSGNDFAKLAIGGEVWINNSKREFFIGYETINNRTFPATIFEKDGQIKQRIIKLINQNTGEIVDYKMKNIQDNNRRYTNYKFILERQK